MALHWACHWSPVPSAKTLQSTTGLAPYEAEAHLGTLLPSRSRWSPRSWKSLQTEVNPCSKGFLSLPIPGPQYPLGPEADVPEYQANPVLQVPPASQKPQTGPQLSRPTCLPGTAGLGWGIYQPKVQRAPRKDCEGKSQEDQAKVLRSSNSRPATVAGLLTGSLCQSCALKHPRADRAL